MPANAHAVLGEHHGNVGFVIVNSRNPWTNELGIGNVASCMAGATRVPFHHGYLWWPDDQFGREGSAYCPAKMNVAIRHGEWMADHTSRGDPCDVRPLDLVLYDWNGNGEADHVETAIETRIDGGRTHNIGYNTGGGVKDLWRDAQYLLGRIRPLSDSYVWESTPPPEPGNPNVYRGRALRWNGPNRPLMEGKDIEHLQRHLGEVKNYRDTFAAHGGYDGAYGEWTARVVRDFQYNQNVLARQLQDRPLLEEDAVAGQQTWERAFS